MRRQEIAIPDRAFPAEPKSLYTYRLTHCLLKRVIPIQAGMRWLESAYPDRARGWVGFNVPMSHKITAGCDLLLMPSRFEPCGLNQLYAMRYGTVPVAHATGGLRDTVLPFNPWEGACLRKRGLSHCARCYHGSYAAPEGHAEVLPGPQFCCQAFCITPADGPGAGSKFSSG